MEVENVVCAAVFNSTMVSKDNGVQGFVQSIGNTEMAQDVDPTSQPWSVSNHHRFVGRRASN